MAKIIVFGSLNMDVSIGCERMPRSGETVHGEGLVLNPGGKGGNQAVAAAKMGADVRMVAAVGDDAFGPALLKSLEASGVRCEDVAVDAANATGTAVILRSQGDNRIVVELGANGFLDARAVEAVLDRIAEPGDMLLMQFECDLEATAQVAAYAHGRGIRVVVNPAPMHGMPVDFWRSVDLLCLNETECEGISGVLPQDAVSIEAALAACSELGVASTVLTLGSRGSVAREGDDLVRVAAPKVDVVDTTGAGDTYLGALLAALAEGRALEDAMRLASCAAALATTKVGAQQAVPTRAEADAAEASFLTGA